MNDENLTIYLFDQFNKILDSTDADSKKQDDLGKLFLYASTCISAIYLINHPDEASKIQKLASIDMNLDLAKLLKNEWYIYTNIEIWLDFIHSVFNEISSNHSQYNFYLQVMSSVDIIQINLGLDKPNVIN